MTWTFLVRCAGAAASLGYGLLLADLLAPAAMGEFTIAVSVAVIAATVSKFGLDAYLMRRAADRPQSARRLTVRCLCAAGLAGALAWAACVWVGSGVRPGAGLAFGVLLLGIPFLAMSYVLTGLLKAGDLPAAAVFLETGGWQSAMCVGAILMLLVGSDSLLLAALCFAAGSALVFIGFLFAAGHLVFGGASFAPRARPVSGGGLREVVALAGLNAGNVFMRWSDTLWLAWWLDAGEVAVYVVCTRLAGGVAFVDQAVNAVAAPRFARHHQRGEARALRAELRRACALSGAWGVVGAAAVALLAPLILDWLGPPYAHAAELAQLAAVAMAARVTLVPVVHLAIMAGRAFDHFRAVALALALQQAAFLLLIPEFGAWVALFGFALAPMLAYLATWALLRRQGEFGWMTP